ncbi:MAG TPA: hypothetical protein VL242_27785, partial [Sorangium sp.]|nr:hypothetical protein [Sorangium sp.]
MSTRVPQEHSAPPPAPGGRTSPPPASGSPVRFPEELPISARVLDIARAIEAHQVVIVAGETGSGKTT